MKACSVERCTGKYLSKGYCRKHYLQIIRHGKILERTIYDLNTYWFENNICYIQIFDRFNNPKCVVMIDVEDYEKVKDYKWGCYGNGYIGNKTFGYLSRYIMNITNPNIKVDHKFHNLFDNRKSFLRPCFQNQNIMNSHKKSNNTSGYKGVIWFIKRNKWMGRIQTKGKLTILGYYNTKEEAAKAYDEKAKELFGEFAKLNFPRKLPR
jgi:hypothetical protein